jgi:hypothetical protein
MIQTSASGYRPPATGPRTPIVIIEGERAASSRSSNRQYRAKAQRSSLSAFNPELPGTGRAIADTGPIPKSP